MNVLTSALKQLGYTVQPFLMSATSYGLPQLRKRLTFVAPLSDTRLFECQGAKMSETWLALGEMLRSMQRAPPSVESVLLSPDHSLAQKELFAMLDKTAKASTTESEDGKWKELHMTFLSQNGMRWGALRALPSMTDSAWWPVLTSREKEVLAYAAHVCPETHGTDYSQAMNRVNHFSMLPMTDGSHVWAAPTLLCNSRFWSEGRILCSWDHFTLQGYPWQKLEQKVLEETSDSLVRDMAGNVYPLSMMLALFYGILFTFKWTGAIPHDDDADGVGEGDEGLTPAAAVRAAFRCLRPQESARTPRVPTAAASASTSSSSDDASEPAEQSQPEPQSQSTLAKQEELAKMASPDVKKRPIRKRPSSRVLKKPSGDLKKAQGRFQEAQRRF